MLTADIALSTGSAVILLGVTSVPTLWVLTAMYGLGMASIFPTVISVVETYMDVTGGIATTFVVGASAGEMVIPVLLGLTIDTLGDSSFPVGIFLSSVAQCIFCAMLFFWGTQVEKGAQQPVDARSSIECEISMSEHKAICDVDREA